MATKRTRTPAKEKAPRKQIDPRQVGPIAYVVDSSGAPVKHLWRPSGGRRRRSTTIGIYWQETALTAKEMGIHTVWSSDEDHGDTFPWKVNDPKPRYLTQFMREASSGTLSATFKLTEWGRECADQRCKCRSGSPLEETARTESKKDERGGMNSKEWKKYLRKIQTQPGSS